LTLNQRGQTLRGECHWRWECPRGYFGPRTGCSQIARLPLLADFVAKVGCADDVVRRFHL